MFVINKRVEYINKLLNTYNYKPYGNVGYVSQAESVCSVRVTQAHWNTNTVGREAM